MLLAIVSEEKLVALGMKCLTVAGGFVAGWVIGMFIGIGLNRWVFKKKLPEGAKKLFKIVSAIVVAILVAVSIFGGGSGGGSFSGDGADGKAAGTATDLEKNKAGSPNVEVKKVDKNKKATPAAVADLRPTEVTIRVTVLGGPDVSNDRYYLIDEDRTAKTFQEVKDAVTARKKSESRKMVVAILRSPPPNRAPLDGGSVTQFVRWAQNEAKLDITFPAEK